jgi:hypothetical protein
MPPPIQSQREFITVAGPLWKQARFHRACSLQLGTDTVSVLGARLVCWISPGSLGCHPGQNKSLLCSQP